MSWWTLVVVLVLDDSVSVIPMGGFKTEEACRVAEENYKAEHTNVIVISDCKPARDLDDPNIPKARQYR